MGEWINKKVYIKMRDSPRSYSGRVINEDELSITFIDVMTHHVRILKADASIIQEEA